MLSEGCREVPSHDALRNGVGERVSRGSSLPLRPSRDWACFRRGCSYDAHPGDVGRDQRHIQCRERDNRGAKAAASDSGAVEHRPPRCRLLGLLAEFLSAWNKRPPTPWHTATIFMETVIISMYCDSVTGSAAGEENHRARPKA